MPPHLVSNLTSHWDVQFSKPMEITLNANIMTGNKRKASDDAAGIRSQPRNERPLGEPTADSESNTLGRSKPGRPSRPVPGVAADGYFRQLYATEPDFRQLARRDPQFAAV